MTVFLWCTILVVFLLAPFYEALVEVKWCTVLKEEQDKCELMSASMSSPPLGVPASNYKLTCVEAMSKFECMQKIDAGAADIVNLDSGLGYYASRYFTMTPLMYEKYSGSHANYMYAVMAVKRRSSINANQLRGKKVCIPGIGTGAGWTLPIAELIQKEILPITRCNVPVKSTAEFFSSLCAPGAMEEIHNPFGINPVRTCELCDGRNEQRCTDRDPFAGYDGALDCLDDATSLNDRVAFVKHSALLGGYNIAPPSANATNPPPTASQDHELLCPDGSRRDPSMYEQCNWGKMAANVLMVSALQNEMRQKEVEGFVNELVHLFGQGGALAYKVPLAGGGVRADLMFSDEVIDVEKMPVHMQTVYEWLDSTGIRYQQKLDALQSCPLQVVRWCVVSEDEMHKCEDMILAFSGKNLKPSLDCILGGSTHRCMDLLKRGNADMMSVEAGDMYTAGAYYGLVPIAMEDYGISVSQKDDSPAYYSVAVVKKETPDITLFNLKFKRVCLPAVGSGSGWILPVSLFQETLQINSRGCDVLDNIGEFLQRACIPGVLDPKYNPTGIYPVNLCEGCASGSGSFCERDSTENYYGPAGAFRCLVEGAGDIAFVDHPTPRGNTDGRNQDEWARNRRADDYELLCKDGSRGDLNSWRTCNLGRLPPDAVVTGGHKCLWEKRIYWDLLNFAQSYFSSDTNDDFRMFDSGRDLSDLIFKDAAVRLRAVDEAAQSYEGYLPHVFRKYAQKADLQACGDKQKISSVPKQCPGESSGASRLYAAVLLLPLFVML